MSEILGRSPAMLDITFALSDNEISHTQISQGSIAPCLSKPSRTSIRTGETAFLFLQHFIKILKAGGRGGVVIKNTFLSNTDNASVSLRKLLLESCNLYSVLDCPGGAFQGAGVKTVVLRERRADPQNLVLSA
jgi:hypothetical protein